MNKYYLRKVYSKRVFICANAKAIKAKTKLKEFLGNTMIL